MAILPAKLSYGTMISAVLVVLVLSLTIQPTLIVHPSLLASATPVEGPGARIPGQYIVVLKSDDTKSATNGQSAANEARGIGAEVLHVYEHAIKGFSVRANEHVLEAIQKNPNVAYIEEDQTVKSFAKRPSFSNTSSQVLPNGVNRVDGDLSSKSGDWAVNKVDVDIAIVDTGVELTHPDLNVYRNIGFVRGTVGGNDDQGHGTHVAGIAAALDNSIGVVGTSPGARIWAVKVLDRFGSGSMSDVVKGVDYVTQHADEIDVVNMSLGCSCKSGSLDNAIHNSVAAGITYTVAGGNDHKDASTFLPANHPDVIAVSAIADTDGKCGGLGSATGYGSDDSFATFSNYGSVIDMAAPGVSIYSTHKGGSYAYLSGTSMASPHIAGAAALYKSTHPAASPSDVKAALTNSGSTPTTTCDGNGYGYFAYGADLDTIREPLLYARNY